MKPNQDTEIQPGYTVGDLVDDFEGTEYDSHYSESDRHILCDFCSAGISRASVPRVGGYVADNVLNKFHPIREHIKEERPIIPLATYCEDCTEPLLFYPCEGFAEARIEFTIEEDDTIRDVEVLDVSDRKDGIPYNPAELSSKVTQVPFAENELMAGPELWGPENMITFFLSVTETVDIRDVIDYDGSINPKALGRARKEWQRHAKEYAESGADRQAFRDQVRDKR